jgi:hypothetical protein
MILSKKKSLLYLVYSQIWLYLLVDDCQFRYITKLKKKRKEKKKALELQLTNTLFSPGYIYSQK